MSEKRIFTSLSASHVKNQGKTISTEDKLDVISGLAKCERIVDMLDSLIVAYIQLVIALIEL